MILIIAEKPRLARNIAEALGAGTKREGYLEGAGYCVTWAFGHLFSLCDVEEYIGGERGGKWTMDALPCFPETFRFRLRENEQKEVDPGVLRQFQCIKSLLAREDLEKVVNAGDADREGEIIVRIAVKEAGGTDKPFLRLWLPDQTPETVRQAAGDLKPESEYDNLAGEGMARTYIDWLYGVNLTRYATLKTGTLLRVGRVIVPIVKAIYDRDLAIEAFDPETYYVARSCEKTGDAEVELVSKKKFSAGEKAKAQSYADQLNALPAIVKSAKSAKSTLSPGKLYSLSKLQNALGKKYKMSMETSLKIVQSLYERGFVTYPRTNSEYLATAEKDKIRKILGELTRIGYPVKFKDGKSIFDDKKIESHSALTPTTKIPDKNALSEEEKKVYQTILRRFVAVFCAEECVCRKSEIVVAVGDLEEFVLKGTVILEKGWTRFDEAEKKDKILPDLKEGDRVNTRFIPAEKKTSPPKHYTIETLNNYLKNPFREEKARAEEEGDDAADYKAMFEGLELGTEATRTGIIDNAIKSRYIDLKKDVYTILPGGRFLIESLAQMQISMDKYKTSVVGKALKRVFHGESTVEESVSLAKDEVREVFSRKNVPPEEDRDTGFYGDEVGVCPLCGKKVVRGRYAYGCSGYNKDDKDKGCPFRIWITQAGRPVPVSAVKALLETGRTGLLKGFVSRKTGKAFDAALKLEGAKTVFVFPPRPEGGKGATRITAPDDGLPWDELSALFSQDQSE